ncbi:hypothetical protein HK098_002534 [Nowakowskiella sp. JEL0407]|nr:hypothetical protein HK098_002534 [Nowakowskiella sp. JEL0407]
MDSADVFPSDDISKKPVRFNSKKSSNKTPLPPRFVDWVKKANTITENVSIDNGNPVDVSSNSESTEKSTDINLNQNIGSIPMLRSISAPSDYPLFTEVDSSATLTETSENESPSDSIEPALISKGSTHSAPVSHASANSPLELNTRSFTIPRRTNTQSKKSSRDDFLKCFSVVKRNTTPIPENYATLTRPPRTTSLKPEYMNSEMVHSPTSTYEEAPKTPSPLGSPLPPPEPLQPARPSVKQIRHHEHGIYLDEDIDIPKYPEMPPLPELNFEN